MPRRGSRIPLRGAANPVQRKPQSLSQRNGPPPGFGSVSFSPALQVRLVKRFSEKKVIKVKADVAAILNSFPRAQSPSLGAEQREATHGLRPIGGSRKGGEAPLAGGAAARGRASGFGWRGTCSGVGGTFPAPALPLGETGKGDQIPCSLCSSTNLRFRSPNF